MLDVIGELLAELVFEAGEEVSIHPKISPKLRLILAVIYAIIYFGLGGFIIFGALTMRIDSGSSKYWIKGLILLTGLLLIGFGMRLMRRQWRVHSKNNLVSSTDRPKS